MSSKWIKIIQLNYLLLCIFHHNVTINREREELVGMRKSICGSLRHLGADLYSSALHFIHELVQNADDNRYSQEVIFSYFFNDVQVS
jgi:hypothetical protein